MELDKALEERHSVTKFKQKKPDWRKIMEAIEAARKVPLAGNIYSLKFILVDNKNKIKSIAEAAQQEFVNDAKYVVVACSDSEQLVRNYKERGEVYSRQQAGAAIENFLLKITELGLSTCWVGALHEDEIKKTLTVPDNIKVEAVFPIGYEMGKNKQKRKPDLDDIVFSNKWKQKKMSPENKPR